MIVPYRIFQPTARILSATSAPDLLHWVTHSLDLGSTYLLVDLRDVMFMDSSGLGALVIAKKRVEKAGGTFALCSVGGQARMVLEMSGLEDELELHDSAHAFMETFSSQAWMRSPTPSPEPQ
jgi:anti-sigma B factor antagonist